MSLSFLDAQRYAIRGIRQGWGWAPIPFIGAVAWQFDGIFIGAMRSLATRSASIAATVLCLGADLLLTPALLGSSGDVNRVRLLPCSPDRNAGRGLSGHRKRGGRR